jgi:TolA-binding protein
MNDPIRWLDKPNDILLLEQRLLRSGASLKLPAETQDQAWTQFRALVGLPPLAGPNQSGPLHSGGSASSGTGTQSALTHTTSVGNTGLAHLAGVGTKVGITQLVLIGAAVVVGGSMAIVADHFAPQLQTFPVASTSNHAATRLSPANSKLSIRQGTPVVVNSAEPLRSVTPNTQRNVTEFDQHPPQVVPPPSVAQQPTGNEQRTDNRAPAVAVAMPNLDKQVTATGKVAAADNPHVSELKAEAIAVANAKNLITSGQFQTATVLLSQISQRFAAGALAPEREALMIEALAGSGSLPLAQQRAAAFLAQYPQSPLADKIRKFARPQ